MVAPRGGPPASWRLQIHGGLAALVVSLTRTPAAALVAVPAVLGTTELRAAPGDGGGTQAGDLVVVIAVVALVGCCVGLIALLRRALRSEPELDGGSDRGRGSTVWRSMVRHVCADGRSVVDLTTERTSGEPGSGLTLNQLGHLESRLSLLIGQLDDAEVGAPSLFVVQTLRTAAMQAENLNSLVQTERRLRLTSVHPSMALLDATALQVSKARTSLDEALRDVSQSINELD